jgi:hypothetical protein
LIDRERDVPGDRQPGEQRVVLKDDTAIGSRTGELACRASSGDTGSRSQQTGHQREQRRFAGSGKADDGDELARLDTRRLTSLRTSVEP